MTHRLPQPSVITAAPPATRLAPRPPPHACTQQGGLTATATPNLFAGTFDTGTQASAQGSVRAVQGPLSFQVGGAGAVTPAAVSIDASRLFRGRPDSISLRVGAVEGGVTAGPTLQRRRYVFVAGQNLGGLPGFATNAAAVPLPAG
jgi:hypothetical protein